MARHWKLNRWPTLYKFALIIPTYIHCFAGKGRSATFLAAYLLKVGTVDSINKAEAYMKDIRSVVKLGNAQKRCLEKYYDGFRKN